MFLLVDDQPLVLRVLFRMLGDRPAMCAASATEARAMAVSRTDWSGYIVDVGLPEGPAAGIDLLHWLSARDCDAERALITGRPDQVATEAASRLGATLLSKPVEPELFAEIMERADAKTGGDPIVEILARAKHDYQLTPREVSLLAHTASGRSASSYGRTAGIATTTYKTHRNAIRRKTGARSPELLVIRLLADALRRRSH